MRAYRVVIGASRFAAEGGIKNRREAAPESHQRIRASTHQPFRNAAQSRSGKCFLFFNLYKKIFSVKMYIYANYATRYSAEDYHEALQNYENQGNYSKSGD